jgi:hypothetical protein
MNATRAHEACIFGRIPILVTLGVVIGYGAFQALTGFRIGAAETKIENMQRDVVDMKVALGKLDYVKQALDRIEASVGRAERKP